MFYLAYARKTRAGSWQYSLLRHSNSYEFLLKYRKPGYVIISGHDIADRFGKDIGEYREMFYTQRELPIAFEEISL